MIKTARMLRFSLVSLNLGKLNSLLLIFLKIKNDGQIKLKKRKIFQSKGICKKLRTTPKTTKTPRPNPILIRVLSKKFSEFLTKNVKPRPNP